MAYSLRSIGYRCLPGQPRYQIQMIYQKNTWEIWPSNYDEYFFPTVYAPQQTLHTFNRHFNISTTNFNYKINVGNSSSQFSLCQVIADTRLFSVVKRQWTISLQKRYDQICDNFGLVQMEMV